MNIVLSSPFIFLVEGLKKTHESLLETHRLQSGMLCNIHGSTFSIELNKQFFAFELSCNREISIAKSKHKIETQITKRSIRKFGLSVSATNRSIGQSFTRNKIGIFHCTPLL
jgi:hypothetical protein